MKNKFKGFSQVGIVNKIVLVIALSISLVCKDAWFIDFGVSRHLTFQKEVFSTFEKNSLNHKVYLGDDNTFDVCEKGNIVFNLLNEISKCIGDVLYFPKLANNLLLVNWLIEQGFKVEFETTKCWLKSFNSNKVITKVIQEGRLYKS